MFRSNLILFVCLPLIGLTAAAQQHGKYQGVGSCASSNCHGAQSPRRVTSVLQNEYVVWLKRDRHAKAYESLGSADSIIMAKHLGIGDPQSEPMCLSCHSVFSSQKDSNADKYFVDGVGCEGCHGAAGNWLSSHAVKGVSHQDNLKNGMLDLVSARERTKLCASCHFGQASREINHRIYGAGHPRLSFESDTFTAIMPYHWELDEDYRKRKSEYNPTKYWLLGQVELAKREVERGKVAVLSKLVWPEFSSYYCYSCHHSLGAKQFRSADYGEKPGQPRLNISSLKMLVSALGVLEGSLSDKLSAAIKNLHRIADADAIERLTSVVTEIEPVLGNKDLGEAAGRALFRKLREDTSSKSVFYYEEAEQYAMAFSVLATSFWPKNEALKREIDQVFKVLRSPDGFDAANFAQACAELKSSEI